MNLEKLFGQIGLLEVTIAQLIIYTLIWLTNDYLGFLLSCVMVPLVIGVVIVSWIADRIEHSGISKRYYLFMLSLILSPLLITAIFIATGTDVNAWFAK
jgi:MFS family permease